MKPFWHLGILASSFIMLNESTENTLYNVAQVANITQLVGALQKFKYELYYKKLITPPPPLSPMSARFTEYIQIVNKSPSCGKTRQVMSAI